MAGLRRPRKHVFHIPRNDLYRSSIGLLSWDHPLGTLSVYPRVSACRRCTETLHENNLWRHGGEKPNSLLTSRTNEQSALHDGPMENKWAGPAVETNSTQSEFQPDGITVRRPPATKPCRLASKFDRAIQSTAKFVLKANTAGALYKRKWTFWNIHSFNRNRGRPNVDGVISYFTETRIDETFPSDAY